MQSGVLARRWPLAGTVYATSRRLAVFRQATADVGGHFELKGLGEGPFYLLAQAPNWLLK